MYTSVCASTWLPYVWLHTDHYPSSFIARPLAIIWRRQMKMDCVFSAWVQMGCQGWAALFTSSSRLTSSAQLPRATKLLLDYSSPKKFEYLEPLAQMESGEGKEERIWRRRRGKCPLCLRSIRRDEWRRRLSYFWAAKQGEKKKMLLLAPNFFSLFSSRRGPEGCGEKTMQDWESVRVLPSRLINPRCHLSSPGWRSPPPPMWPEILGI